MVERIWIRFHEKLLKFILTKVSNTSIAEDIVQDVFIQVIKSIDTLEDEGKLQAWLYQICRNRIIDYYRVKKLVVVDIDVYETIEAEHKHDDVFELNNCIRNLISELPANVNAILVASELNNIKQEQIAINEALSLSAVKSRLKRGRVLLKKKLLACCSIEFTENGADATCKNQCGCHL